MHNSLSIQVAHSHPNPIPIPAPGTYVLIKAHNKEVPACIVSNMPLTVRHFVLQPGGSYKGMKETFPIEHADILQILDEPNMMQHGSRSILYKFKL